MDPAVAGAIGGGLVVAALGLAIALFAYGRSTRSGEVDVLREELADLRKTLEAERRRERIRAAGAALDLQRATGLAADAAAGDLDGVLQYFPGEGGGDVAAGESSGEADAEAGDDASA